MSDAFQIRSMFPVNCNDVWILENWSSRRRDILASTCTIPSKLLFELSHEELGSYVGSRRIYYPKMIGTDRTIVNEDTLASFLFLLPYFAGEMRGSQYFVEIYSMDIDAVYALASHLTTNNIKYILLIYTLRGDPAMISKIVLNGNAEHAMRHLIDDDVPAYVLNMVETRGLDYMTDILLMALAYKRLHVVLADREVRKLVEKIFMSTSIATRAVEVIAHSPSILINLNEVSLEQVADAWRASRGYIDITDELERPVLQIRACEGYTKPRSELTQIRGIVPVPVIKKLAGIDVVPPYSDEYLEYAKEVGDADALIGSQLENMHIFLKLIGSASPEMIRVNSGVIVSLGDAYVIKYLTRDLIDENGMSALSVMGSPRMLEHLGIVDGFTQLGINPAVIDYISKYRTMSLSELETEQYLEVDTLLQMHNDLYFSELLEMPYDIIEHHFYEYNLDDREHIGLALSHSDPRVEALMKEYLRDKYTTSNLS